MADNLVVAPAASGVSVSTDEIIVGGVPVQVQRVKVGFGIDGAYVDTSASTPLPTEIDAIGDQADPVYAGGAVPGTVVSILKKLVALFSAGFAMSGSVSMADAEGIKGAFGGIVSMPSQSFTRPADTIAYVANDIVANSIAGGSVAYGTLLAARVAGGSFQIDRLRLASSHTTGLAGVTMRVRLWSHAAPTYTNGDNGTYAVSPIATASSFLGSFVGGFDQFNDVAVAQMVPDNGSPCVKLPAGEQSIWWDIQTLDPFTPQSGRSFTLVAEIKQD